ncbi:MAG: hypothetical protein ACYC6R_01310 [Anaerolineales bacterium]
MNTEPEDDPGKKMRKLLGSSPPVLRLPKKHAHNTSLPAQLYNDDQQAATSEPSKAAFASTLKGKPGSVSKGRLPLFDSPLWNVASVISLAVNAILVIALIVLAIHLNSFGLRLSSMLSPGSDVLGGLYGNFEKMDRAHLTTDIEVNTTIPVQFDLQLNQQTNVVLSQDTTVQNALITLETGVLNITRANSTIVLPQGTILPIVLNLTVPVDTTVPITLHLPLDIPLDKTQLHEPFTGLQEVLKPFYCMVDGNAVNMDGEPICK